MKSAGDRETVSVGRSFQFSRHNKLSALFISHEYWYFEWRTVSTYILTNLTGAFQYSKLGPNQTHSLKTWVLLWDNSLLSLNQNVHQIFHKRLQLVPILRQIFETVLCFYWTKMFVKFFTKAYNWCQSSDRSLRQFFAFIEPKCSSHFSRKSTIGASPWDRSLRQFYVFIEPKCSSHFSQKSTIGSSPESDRPGNTTFQALLL
jgi:hypothetical protein